MEQLLKKEINRIEYRFPRKSKWISTPFVVQKEIQALHRFKKANWTKLSWDTKGGKEAVISYFRFILKRMLSFCKMPMNLKIMEAVVVGGKSSFDGRLWLQKVHLMVLPVLVKSKILFSEDFLKNKK